MATTYKRIIMRFSQILITLTLITLALVSCNKDATLDIGTANQKIIRHPLTMYLRVKNVALLQGKWQHDY